MTIKSILETQQHTLHLFLSHPSTRTPIIVLYVASFGGALHAAVTTYFYLAIGATTIDIGHLGFIMSMGAFMGGPICGWSLDKYGPWIPISVTASCCAFGCLWRGLASSITSLRMGAILLGIGVNLWTVVLGHIVKSFPSKLRSEVLAGFTVQMTTLQLCGKGIFPIIEYILHSILQIHNELLRYRIHMGLCTFFCFYGVVALLMDRKNVMSVKNGNNGVELSCCDQSEQKQIEYNIMEKRLDSKNSCDDWHEDHVDNRDKSTQQSQIEQLDGEATASFANESEDSSMIRPSISATTTATNIQQAQSATPEPQHHKRRRKKDILITAILTLALLIQSISTTFLTVLWPLLSKDIFALSAHTFGIITFISSIVSTGAVASFPVVERMEKVGGRVRCAALGFAVSTVLCFLFCYCSFVVNLVDLDGGGDDLYPWTSCCCCCDHL
jgi:MFS family permease